MFHPPQADPSPCARCAQRFPTCCVILPRDVACCFPLSDADRAAIVAQLPPALNPEAVASGASGHLVQESNSPNFLRAMHLLFSGESAAVMRAFPTDGTHWRFGIDVRGACRFVSPRGCMLPRQARPAYCHLFPFWVDRGQIGHFALNQCQAQREHTNRAHLLAAFGMTETMVFELYTALRTAWGMPRSGRRMSGLPPSCFSGTSSPS